MLHIFVIQGYLDIFNFFIFSRALIHISFPLLSFPHFPSISPPIKFKKRRFEAYSFPLQVDKSMELNNSKGLRVKSNH